jgi:hypothetical protein
MEEDFKTKTGTKTIKSKNYNIFENGRRLNFFFKEDDLKFLKTEVDLKKICKEK